MRRHVLHAWYAAATTYVNHTDPQGNAALWGEVSLPQKGSGVFMFCMSFAPVCQALKVGHRPVRVAKERTIFGVHVKPFFGSREFLSGWPRGVRPRGQGRGVGG